MLRRLDELVAEKKDLAFETTLSTRSFIILCEEARGKGYDIYIIFLWLPSTKQAIERARKRVSKGGHNIPDEVVIRRYQAGLKNFTALYQSLVDYWIFIDNSGQQLSLIAEGGRESNTIIQQYGKRYRKAAYARRDKSESD